MKILVVHQYYLLPGFPGGSRFNEFARLWSEAGHEVTVIAGNLDYSTGVVPEEYRGKLVVEERDGDVRVLRCAVPKSYSKSYFGRMWAFLGFTFSSLIGSLRVDRPDVVIATSPPLIAALPGWFASRLHGPWVPWVFEVRDLWPESAITTGVLRSDSIITKILYRLERWAYRRADKINVLTPAFRDDIIDRGLGSSNLISFVPNGADVERFRPRIRENAVRERLGWKDRFVVMYAGAHGRANAIGQLVDAAELLKDRPDILIASVGDGPERVHWQEEAKRRGLSNIRFYGPQPKDSMPDFVNAADAGAAVLQRNETFRTVYPNKVFDYMACKRPTLLAIDGAARRLVIDDAKAGVYAEPEDPASIADAIRWMVENPEACEQMGERGYAWVHANATRDSLARKYLDVLEGLVERRSSLDVIAYHQ